MEFGPILRAMSRNKVRFGLILIEIALSLAIVVNCLTLVQKARGEMGSPSGFADEELLHVRTMPFDPELRERARLDEVVERDLDALRRIPGVKDVSTTRFLPWQGGGSSGEIRPMGSKGGFLRIQQYNADSHTMATLGASLVYGRTFTEDEVTRETRQLRELFSAARPRNSDATAKEPYLQDVVMSRAFAELAFGDANAVGKMLEDKDGDHYRVIGVIDRYHNPFQWKIDEYGMFFASRGHGYEGGCPYLVRAEPGAIGAVRQAIESAIVGVNPGREVKIESIVEVRERYHGANSIVVKVLTGVIALVVFITFLGIVGLTSFSVAERTRQIGTRRALGAQRIDIIKHFLLENWLVTTMGICVGVPLTIALNVAVVNKLAGAKVEAVGITVACVLLWLAGLLATLFPALRGAAVTPATATRNV